MNRYDRIVALKQEDSRQKYEEFCNAIDQMYQDGERINICELQRRTGMSHSYFYNNENVRKKIASYRKRQKGQNLSPTRQSLRISGLEAEIRELKKRLNKSVPLDQYAALENELKQVKNQKLLDYLRSL